MITNKQRNLVAHRGGLKAPLYPRGSLFERVGGRDIVGEIIDGLYDRIETDTHLRPMFVRSLEEERKKQKAFFEEWMGGEPLYTYHYAYSGLLARHSHIHISGESANRWLSHMKASLKATLTNKDLIKEITEALRPLAQGLANEPQDAGNPKHLRCHRVNRWRNPKELAAKGNLQELKVMIDSDPLLLSDRRQAAELLQAAVRRDHREMITLLIDRGVDVNIPTGLEVDLLLTPHCLAIWKKHDQLSRYLESRGAVYDIFSASFLGDLAAVTTMCGSAPELVNASDPACDFLAITPLYHAVYGNHCSIVSYLFSSGAQVGPASTRLVRRAAENGNVELVHILLNKGADASRVGPGSWVKNRVIADILLEHGADVNYPAGKWVWVSCTGNNSQRDNPEYLAELLKCGADTDTRLRGALPVHHVAKAGHLGSLKVLLDKGADVNAPSDSGETPLLYALKAGKRAAMNSICQILLAAGADPTVKDARGRSAQDIARSLKRTDAREIAETIAGA
ncbi:MAG: hypothetical protein HOH43_12760 [Candidatus Latescibacteria bacterium]|nr:hypothetical protein [Candidatus Latescibacterota bacterium]